MKRPDVLLLANAIMGQFLSGFASRIFIVSLPTIAATLHADIIGISWALIAYQLAGISLSVVFGRLGDVHGRYAIYGGGFAVMAASSLLCGLAPNVLALILSRAVQGIGAAMIASAARVLAIEAMPEGSEGRTSGYMTMAFHSGLLLGPSVGGVLIDLVGWRWVFFLLIPIASAGIALTILGARGRRAERRRGPISIDYLGAALLIALTIMLTVLLDERAARLVGGGRTGMMALLFAVTLAGFVAHETPGHRSRREPLAVPDSHVHVQRREPAARRHRHQHGHVPDAVLPPGRAPALPVVHGPRLPVGSRLHHRLRERERALDRPDRAARSGVDRCARDAGRLHGWASS